MSEPDLRPDNHAGRPLRVLVLSGSMRRDSLNTRLARLAAQVIGDSGGQAELATLAEFAASAFDQDARDSDGIPPGPTRRIEEHHRLGGPIGTSFRLWSTWTSSSTSSKNTASTSSIPSRWTLVARSVLLCVSRCMLPQPCCVTSPRPTSTPCCSQNAVPAPH
jgi:NADPH-dependent FMN reductase